MINETDRRLTPAGATDRAELWGGSEVLLWRQGAGVLLLVSPHLLAPSLLAPLSSVFPGGDNLVYDVNSGQFVPLIGVIAVGVIGQAKRNERAKKEDTTVHYTPAAV